MSTSNLLRNVSAGLLLGALVASSFSARARAAPPEPAPAPGPADDDVSGVLLPEVEPSPSPARHLLFVPRLAVTMVTVPVARGLTIVEEHHLHERLIDLFFDDTRTFGIYPTVALETRLTPGVGMRLVHKNLFGQGGRLRVGGDYGGESRFRLEGGLTSPAIAAGMLRGRLTGGWQRQPSAAFFGIGNQSLVSTSDATIPTIPFTARGPFAASTHFAQRVAHAELAVEIDPNGPLFAAVSAAYFKRDFGDDGAAVGADGAPRGDRTEVRFDTASLAGWRQGTEIAYSEAQLGWNTLTAVTPYVSEAAPSTGTKVVAFAGVARGIGGADVGYTRYGVDGFRYFDLYHGDRVLILRGRLEGVVGSEERIPFTDLPRLGGPVLLRGYDRDRFRDRVAVLGSMEYRYPVSRQLGGFLFIDAGRVLPGLQDVGSAVRAPRQLRAGGGGGLEVLQGDVFRLRGQVAGSPEGFFFQLALEPVYRLPTHHQRI
ncbi:MAG: BamA/TamA family outer membrane protein [Polyangia bacterium]